MNKHYRVLCEECAYETIILAEDRAEIDFCPCCGRRAEPEDITEDDDI
jgi:ribosomal protein S27E